MTASSPLKAPVSGMDMYNPRSGNTLAIHLARTEGIVEMEEPDALAAILQKIEDFPDYLVACMWAEAILKLIGADSHVTYGPDNADKVQLLCDTLPESGDEVWKIMWARAILKLATERG